MRIVCPFCNCVMNIDFKPKKCLGCGKKLEQDEKEKKK